MASEDVFDRDLCFAGVEDDSESETELDLSVALAQSFQLNPRNELISFPLAEGGRQPKLAMRTGNFWRPGQELRIAFSEGTEWQQQKVKETAVEWTKYANLKFTWVKYDKSSPPDILIAFDPSKGSNSVNGTQSRARAARGRPSMNLAWVTEEREKRNPGHFYRTILHEFGHALGAHHEHSSPRSAIPWNKDAIYAEYAKPPNLWDKARVDHNVFHVHPDDEVQTSRYDPDSIMLYYFPPRYTLDGRGTKNNVVLSELDKAYMRFCYPADTVDAGLFNTLQVAAGDSPVTTATSQQYYHEKHLTPPDLVIGLNMFDMNGRLNLRVKADALDQNQENFTASIGTWGDSCLHAAGMTWLEVGPRFSFIQSGTFNLETDLLYRIRQKNSQRIPFPRTFRSRPTIVCFLKSFEMEKDRNWRFKTYATAVDLTGFTIHVDCGLGTKGASVSWLAYPSDEPSVTSGRFSATDARPSQQRPRPDNTATVKFEKQFSQPPNVLLALDEFSYDHRKNLCIRVGTSMVTESDLTWNLQSWGDSTMYQAGASYFAWGKPVNQENRGGLVILGSK